MRITKTLVMEKVHELNNFLNLNSGNHFHLRKTCDGWQLKKGWALQKPSHCFNGDYMPLRDIYLQVCNLIQGVELAKQYQ